MILGRAEGASIKEKSSEGTESRYKPIALQRQQAGYELPRSRKGQKQTLTDQQMQRVASIYQNSVSLSPVKSYQPNAERRLYNVDSKKILSMRRAQNQYSLQQHQQQNMNGLKLPHILNSKGNINSTKLTQLSTNPIYEETKANQNTP